MRESTINTISMLSDMWKRNFPMADDDCFLLIGEIACAYENNEVSAESCMEEILLIVKERQAGKQELCKRIRNEVGEY